MAACVLHVAHAEHMRLGFLAGWCIQLLRPELRPLHTVKLPAASEQWPPLQDGAVLLDSGKDTYPTA